MSRRDELNGYLLAHRVLGKSKQEMLNSFFKTNPFFKTLFRDDHPFLEYTITDKHVCVEFRIKFKDGFLVNPPTYFGTMSIMDFGAPTYLDESMTDKRFKDTFYSHVKNYICDVIGFDSEQERDSLKIFDNNTVNYDNVSRYLYLITKNLDFLDTGGFDDAEEFGFQATNLNDGDELINTITLIWSKEKVNQIVKQLQDNNEDVNWEIKRFFAMQVCNNLHRAQAYGYEPSPVLTPAIEQRIAEAVGV